MKIIYFILRLLACPFVFFIIFISTTYHAIRKTILFLIYGGEFITYEEKMNRHTIQEVYLKIVEQQNN